LGPKLDILYLTMVKRKYKGKEDSERYVIVRCYILTVNYMTTERSMLSADDFD
jgi:hypothetical protein